MAYYYPIKCPYCLISHTNETVRFRLSDAVEISTRLARSSTKKTVKAEVFNDLDEDGVQDDMFGGGDGGDWQQDSVSSAGSDVLSSSKSRKKSVDRNKYYTLSDLKGFVGSEIDGGTIISVEGDYKNVDTISVLTRDNSGNIYQDDSGLLTSVTITILNGNGDKEIEKTIFDRYCDCDDGAGNCRKLHQTSGQIPTHVVLLMGSSRSGKTVYLISLYRELMREGGYLLPPSNDQSQSIAKLSLSVLSRDSRGNEIKDTDIKKMSDDLFKHGKLPPSTINMDNEPLIMDITVKFNNSDTPKKAMLFMRDMPGENLTKPNKRHEILKIIKQFPKFDGFMMMFDPITFYEEIFLADDDARDELREQINRLKTVIVEEITPRMDNHMVNQPTAVIITKGDMFFDPNHRSKLQRIYSVNYSKPVLIAQPKKTFDKPYFDEINQGTQDIVKALSKDIYDLVGTFFNDAFFTLVSAFARNPEGLEVYRDADGQKYIRPAEALQPWRTTDPMLRLLMKLNIIPPFDKTDTRILSDDTKMDLAAKEDAKRKIINKWGDEYCSPKSWRNIM